MSRSKVWIVVSLLVAAAMLLSACQTPTTVVETVVVEGGQEVVVAPPHPQEEAPAKKVLRMVSGASDLPTIDPSSATDVANIQIVEMMTVGVVIQNVQTAELEPGMATEWTVSDDGLTYTFKLLDNVPWVKYDAATDSVVNVLDCEGNPRMVKAQDFVYGILRTLNPATAADYAYVLTPAIEGAAAYNDGSVTDPATVGVKAIDDYTLEIKFVAPAVYNLNIAGLWVAHAQPAWIIEGDDCTEGRPDKWTETGFMPAYGPFVLKEWVHDAYITLAKNPLWPGTANIPVAKLDELQWRVLDGAATLAEYEAGNLEMSGIPSADQDRIMTDAAYADQIAYTQTLGTEFYSFQTALEPTNDVRVRQALSMAIDRESLVKNVVKSGKVAPFYTNPGAAGAPKPDLYPDLGVKYDPVKAKEILDGYLAEKGITADQLSLTLVFNTAESHKRNAEAIQQMWKDNLGVTVNLINQERKVSLVTRRDGKEQIYRSSWVQDYPDANNFLADVFGPDMGYANVVDWSGPEYDQFMELITAAASEADPAKRMDLYAQAEQILVVDQAVVAPLYWYNSPILIKNYVQWIPSITGYDRYENWDMTPQP